MSTRITVAERSVTLRNLSVDIAPPHPAPCFVTHHDSKPASPGGNDNASGVAVLLGMLDSWPRDRPARFIFSDGEETGLRGSRGHVRDLVTRGRRHEISAVICPDSVGLDELHLYTADRAGPFPDDLLAPARRAFREHGWAPLERAARSGASDYLPFHELGIPCLFLSDFPNLTRHTTGDGLDRVKLPVLVRLARVLASPELSAPPS